MTSSAVEGQATLRDRGAEALGFRQKMDRPALQKTCPPLGAGHSGWFRAGISVLEAVAAAKLWSTDYLSTSATTNRILRREIAS